MPAGHEGTTPAAPGRGAVLRRGAGEARGRGEAGSRAGGQGGKACCGNMVRWQKQESRAVARICTGCGWCLTSLLLASTAPPPHPSVSYSDMAANVALLHRQCELRLEPLTVPSFGWPPSVLAKGNSTAGFVGGAPLSVAAPLVPGFTRHLGRGLFGQPGYSCDDAVR